MDENWDDDDTPRTSAPSQSFGTGRGGKGRGFNPIVEESGDDWGGQQNRGGRGDGGGQYGGYDGGRRGRGGRGGGRGSQNGDSSGRREDDWICPDSSCQNNNFGFRQKCQKCDTEKPGGGDRGGQYGDYDGGRRGRGGRGGGRGSQNGDSSGRREDDWICPDSSCQNNNFGFRQKCQKCDTEKPGGGDGDGQYGDYDGGRRDRGGRGGGGGRGRGAQNGDSSGRREDDWICPDSSCQNNNFGFRQKCQKCDTEKPGGGDRKPRPELYIPPEPSDDDNILYGGGISSGINFDHYDSIKVKVTGNNYPEPIKDFSSAGLRPFVLDNIRKSGYTKPTPVQKVAIPVIMNGRDLMACAQTGSGKTAAFLIPIINTLLEDQADLVIEGETCQPQVVIVSPTRELAIQISEQARKFSKGSIIKVCLCYGGAGTLHQLSRLVNGCHILVATPGRLKDFVNRGRISFGSVRFFVLDEADRMLDMGFLEDMKSMLNHDTMTPTGERKTLMFSATFPDEIQQLAGQFLQNYIFAAIGIVGGACADVQQTFYEVSRKEKKNKLKELLMEDETKVLVFVETKRNADFIAVYLSEQNIPTTSIHGDREQREREIALNDFKYDKMRVLVATAVAARGLDIKGVAHVINFDLPKSIDEYVHRIGRTGRVGNRGMATSFFDSDVDGPLAPYLVKILQQAEQEVPDWLDSASYGGGSSFNANKNFGGTDFRKANSFNNGPQAQPHATEDEEEW